MNAAAHTLDRPITILICALGGEGGGVLSEWLVEAALEAGYPVQSTSIPGVAQRTGATTYYVEIFPVSQRELGMRRPVFSLYPVPGALDVLVSSELLETVRQIGNGLASPDRTQVITSPSRTLTTNERMQLGDGRMASEPMLEVVRRYSREHHVVDMGAVTREAGTVVSAVMFGALAASGALPFGRAPCEVVIRAGGKGAEASLCGFDRAHAIVAEARARVDFVQRVVDGGVPEAPSVAAARTELPTLRPDLAAGFPAGARDLVALGHARVHEYQDAAYADLYIARLSRVAEAERASDPTDSHEGSITRETARYLALWMAFDDIVRVADLKCRAARRDRVRREVKVADGELLRVYDHFKPGVPEVAALLPATLAQALNRWDRRRQARGLAPFALPLKVGTHSVVGFAALRVLAGLRWLRRRGTRFATEQALIERWLDAVVRGTTETWTLGHEIALCGRLIKGYGSTNERGKANLLHVVDHLATTSTAGSSATSRAEAIAAARTAALADEAGTALDQVLTRHGAPTRPLAESPIRFVRRLPAGASRAPDAQIAPR
ncbi:MAG: indolepyruvate oxidoreductase subunit beta family protein [Caldimonas sp.]